jgi:predicted tellurium resistance membrane protein TerC
MFVNAAKFLTRFSIMLLLALFLASFLSNAAEAWGQPATAIAEETSSAVDVETDAVDVQDETRRKDEYHDPGLVGNLFTLLMLVVLQAVLGFDNLLYISLESKHAPEEKRQSVRAWGIGLAIFLRIALLFALVYSKKFFEETSILNLKFEFCKCNVNLHSLIVFAGGAFIMYTAMKEIWHMTRLEHDDHGKPEQKRKSIGAIIFWIVVMNIVFSFDSILSAMALTDVLWVMTLAIIISGIMMIVLSDHVANFLEKNRMYEVLGLFVLLIVGIMLVSEGGHLAHLNFFGNDVQPMTKTTFYFVLAVLVLIDIVQGRYQKKLLAENGTKGHSEA